MTSAGEPGEWKRSISTLRLKLIADGESSPHPLPTGSRTCSRTSRSGPRTTPHHDAQDIWDALEHMAEYKVPEKVQRALLGENARKLYGIEPVVKVTERVPDYSPAILPW